MGINKKRMTKSFLIREIAHSLFVFTLPLLTLCQESWAYSLPRIPQMFSHRNSRPQIVSINLDPKNRLNGAFRLAIRENRINDAKKYLAKGAKVDSASDKGETALMYASRRCSIEAIQFLLEHGADANLRDHAGRTPLIYTARESCSEGARILLKQPLLKVHVKDHMQKTALDYAQNGSLLEVGGPAADIVRMIEKRQG